MDELCGICLGRLNTTTTAFYETTPLELHHALVEVRRKEENQIRIQYEAARLISFHTWNSSGRTLKTMIKDPKTFMPFAWDKEIIPVQQSAQEIKSVLMAFAIQQNATTKKEDNGR